MKKLLALLLALSMLCGCTAFAESAPAVQCASLQLYGNPSTGYVWNTVSSDEAVAVVVEEGFLPDDETLTGAPGMTQLSIAGKSAGTASLTFTYARPWETESAPLFSFAVDAVVDDTLATVLIPMLKLPQIPGSGLQWAYAQSDAETVQIVLDEDGTAAMLGQTDGTTEVILAYLSPATRNLYWAFLCTVCVQDGVAAILSMEFYQDLSADPFAADLSFSTTDLDGAAVTDAIFAEHALTILNFWEPWCGPCVSEMPALQKLNEEYDDVQVIGIFETPDSDDEVRAILESTGVTYPILHYVSEFDGLQTGYVPTTVVVNSDGKIVHGPTSGAMNYDSWCALVESLR